MLRKLPLISIFILIFIILVLSVSAIPGNGSFADINKGKQILGSPFETSLSRSRFALVKSIVDDNTVIVDKYAETTFPDIIYASGHYYSVFDPGPVLFALPFYDIGKQINLGVFFVGLLNPIAILALAFTEYLLLKKLNFNSTISCLTTFLVVFATGIYTYSTSFNAHPLSALSISIAVFAACLVLKDKNLKIGYPLIWFSLGLGIIMDYPNLVSIIPFIILIFITSSKIVKKNDNKFLRLNFFFLFSSIASLLFLVPLSLYTNRLFGSYLTTIEPHQIQGYMENGKKVLSLSSDLKFYLTHQIVYKDLSISPSYTLSGLFTLLFSLPRGIFLFSPICILAILGIKSFLREFKPIALACIFAIILTLLLYSSYIDYPGGWTYGPRYLIGIMPLVGVFLAYSLKTYFAKKLYLLIFSILSILSISISTLGALTSRIASGSPLEGAGWGWSSSFVKNIPLVGNEPYVSFAYDQYLSSFISKSQFFYIMLVLIILIFLILTTNSYRENRRYYEKLN